MSEQREEPPEPRKQPPPHSGPPPSGTGPIPRPAGSQPGQGRLLRADPPNTVTAAMVLWLCAGALMMITLFALMGNTPEPSYASGNSAGQSASFIAAVVTLCIANRLRWGSTTVRGWLTVLGLPLLTGLVPAPFVIAAIVLQYLPSSNAWFREVNPPRLPPPGPPRG